jgi:hypothetical protein
MLASCSGAGSNGGEQGSSEFEEDTQSMAHGDIGSETLMENGEYSDERFIDHGSSPPVGRGDGSDRPGERGALSSDKSLRALSLSRKPR